MKQRAIRRAQVYGMRCSGTNYLDALIRKNFEGLTLGAATPRSKKTFGWKHSDVGTTTYLHRNGALESVELMHLDWASSRDTILFVIYRNPVNWLQSTHRSPHQSPESYGINFSTFIRQPFRAFHCDPPGSESSALKSIRMKQIKYENMIEEYDSIFDLRRTKIKIFDSFKYRFYNVTYINLETLEQDPEKYLRRVAECYHLRMKAQFQDITTYKGGAAPYVKSTYTPITKVDLQYILGHLGWVGEERIGYVPRLAAKISSGMIKIQAQPENILNIFPYTRYYMNGHVIHPSSTQG